MAAGLPRRTGRPGGRLPTLTIRLTPISAEQSEPSQQATYGSTKRRSEQRPDPTRPVTSPIYTFRLPVVRFLRIAARTFRRRTPNAVGILFSLVAGAAGPP